VLYRAWKTWCEENGHKAGAKNSFGRDLRAVVPELGSVQRRIGGKPAWTYTYIGLKPVTPVTAEESAGEEA
jgi:putative DNA primase/helicase